MSWIAQPTPLGYLRLTGAYLVLLRKQLLPGVPYRFTFTLSFLDKQQSLDFTVTRTPALPHVRLLGGLGSITPYKVIHLPIVLKAEDNTRLNVTWTCTNEDGSRCVDAIPTEETGIVTYAFAADPSQSQTSPPFSLKAGTYLVSVTASDRFGSATASKELAVVPGDVSLDVNALKPSTGDHPAGSRIIVLAKASIALPTPPVWTVVVNGRARTNLPNRTSSQGLFFVIPGNTFKGGDTVGITATVDDPTLIPAVGSTEITIHRPPYGGRVLVSPTTGFAFNTTFTMRAPGWAAASASVKLTYLFGYFSPTSGHFQLLAAPSGNSVLTTKNLPASTTPITVGVRVRDNTGALATSFSTVTVHPPLVTTSLQLSPLKDAEQGDMDTLYAFVNNAANLNPETAALTIRVLAKLTALARDTVVDTDTALGAVAELTSEELDQVAGMPNVTEIALSALSVLETAVQTMKEKEVVVSGEVASTWQAVANLLTAMFRQRHLREGRRLAEGEGQGEAVQQVHTSGSVDAALAAQNANATLAALSLVSTSELAIEGDSYASNDTAGLRVDVVRLAVNASTVPTLVTVPLLGGAASLTIAVPNPELVASAGAEQGTADVGAVQVLPQLFSAAHLSPAAVALYSASTAGALHITFAGPAQLTFTGIGLATSCASALCEPVCVQVVPATGNLTLLTTAVDRAADSVTCSVLTTDLVLVVRGPPEPVTDGSESGSDAGDPPETPPVCCSPTPPPIGLYVVVGIGAIAIISGLVCLVKKKLNPVPAHLGAGAMPSGGEDGQQVQVKVQSHDDKGLVGLDAVGPVSGTGDSAGAAPASYDAEDAGELDPSLLSPVHVSRPTTPVWEAEELSHENEVPTIDEEVAVMKLEHDDDDEEDEEGGEHKYSPSKAVHDDCDELTQAYSTSDDGIVTSLPGAAISDVDVVPHEAAEDSDADSATIQEEAGDGRSAADEGASFRSDSSGRTSPLV